MLRQSDLRLPCAERGEYNRLTSAYAVPIQPRAFSPVPPRGPRADFRSIQQRLATRKRLSRRCPPGRAASARRPHEAPPLAKLLPTARGVLGADPPASRDDLRRPGHTQRLDALGTGAALWYEDRLRQHPWRPPAATAADAHRGPAGRPRPTAGRRGRSDGRAGRGVRIGQPVVEVELDAGDCSLFAYRSASRSSTMPCGCRCIACTI